jgi:hypothetical protein
VIDIKFIQIKKNFYLIINHYILIKFILKIIFTKINKKIKLFLKSTEIPLGIGDTLQ